MPVVRVNKTLQRVKLQSQISSTMEYIMTNTDNSAHSLKLLSMLFEKAAGLIKKESMDEFLKKQPALTTDLETLVTIIDNLKKEVDDLKANSPTLKELIENGETADVEKLTAEFIRRVQEISLNEPANGNGVNGNGVNGKANVNSNGNSNGDISAYVIDPLKWTPEFPKIPKEKPLFCTISHINSPSDFYLHPYRGVVEFIMTVQREQDDLIRKGILALPEVAEGMFCAARFSEDFYWYRAKIVEVIRSKTDPQVIEKVKVFYLDYGNTAEVTLDNLMPMSNSLANEKVKAVHCYFCHYTPEQGWSEEATKAFKEKTNNGTVKVYFSKSAPLISETGTFPYFPIDMYLENEAKVFDVLQQFTKIEAKD